MGPLGSLVPVTETFKGSVPSEANPDSPAFWKASPFVVPHVSFLVGRCLFPRPQEGSLWNILQVQSRQGVTGF